MHRNPNGLNAKDPFFERMMDERIATLRAFLRMTSEKYDTPRLVETGDAQDCPNTSESADSDNIIPLRRAR